MRQRGRCRQERQGEAAGRQVAAGRQRAGAAWGKHLSTKLVTPGWIRSWPARCAASSNASRPCHIGGIAFRGVPLQHGLQEAQRGGRERYAGGIEASSGVKSANRSEVSRSDLPVTAEKSFCPNEGAVSKPCTDTLSTLPAACGLRPRVLRQNVGILVRPGPGRWSKTGKGRGCFAL